jgi:cytosine/adenosine deaminase-related metal-dependent hydrolase
VSAAMYERAGVTFVNAAIGTADRATLRVQGSRIAGINVTPARGDHVVDLRGDRLLPGLINAHDHLQLNSVPQLDYRHLFRNASEWIADINARAATDAEFKRGVMAPRSERSLAGGLKNLLSGVATVAHHDPCEPDLLGGEFPTRVVAAYGWAHSLFIDGEQRVRDSYAANPADQPWIIHAAEGVDAAAAGEFERLRELGCLGANTLLVHGVALERAQRDLLADAGGALIWCPSSNLRLFGRAAEVSGLLEKGRVALGTDSRLTGAGDLLDELRVARECAGLDEPTLERIVTSDSARVLRLSMTGVLVSGAIADLLVLPAGAGLADVRRRDVRLVMLAGRARYADPDYAAMLAPPTDWTGVLVDGRVKCMQARLAALLSGAKVSEAGVELAANAEVALCG